MTDLRGLPLFAVRLYLNGAHSLTDTEVATVRRVFQKRAPK